MAKSYMIHEGYEIIKNGSAEEKRDLTRRFPNAALALALGDLDLITKALYRMSVNKLNKLCFLVLTEPDVLIRKDDEDEEEEEEEKVVEPPKKKKKKKAKPEPVEMEEDDDDVDSLFDDDDE